MRIGQVFSSLLGNTPTPERPARPPETAHSGASLEVILEAEIVQLSLDSDGVWHAVAPPESASSSSQKPPREPFAPRQLPSTGARVYLATGQEQVRTTTVGLTIDMYV